MTESSPVSGAIPASNLLAEHRPIARPASLGEFLNHRAVLIAEIIGVLLLCGFALTLRLGDPEGSRSNFPDLFDEGIRAEQLLLMRHGFRPFRDIYASQGPLLLDVMYPLYQLLGGTLGAARLTVGLLSLVGIVGIAVAGRIAGGPLAGLLAAGLLAVDPLYLEGSRLALAEVPSIAPIPLAIAAALLFQRRGGRLWLVLAASLLALGVLIKPMAVGAGVPVLAAVLLRPKLRFSDLAVFLLSGLVVVIGSVLFLGPADVYQQIVVYRIGSRASEGWDPVRNLSEVFIEPWRARTSLVTFGALGSLACLALGRRGIPIALWVLATYLVLFLYTPLHPKHQVYMVPAWILAGSVALGGLIQLPRPRIVQLGGIIVAAALLFLCANMFLNAPRSLARGVTLIDDEVDPDLHVYDREVAQTLRSVSAADEFVLTDHPYLAYLADRMVPPELVDPSKGRYRAGVLTGDMAIESATRRDVTAVVFWADRLRRLASFSQWVDGRFTPIHILGPQVLKGRDGKDRSVFVRSDASLDRLWPTVIDSFPVRPRARFEDGLILEGARVSADQVSAGSGVAVTLAWRSDRAISTDFGLVVALLGQDGQTWAAQQLDLDGSTRTARGWTAGRWLLRSAMLTPENGTPAGDYMVVAGLESARGGVARITSTDNSVLPLSSATPQRLIVGSVHVNPNR